MGADQNIVYQAEFRDDLHVLKRARETVPDDPVHGLADQVDHAILPKRILARSADAWTPGRNIEEDFSFIRSVKLGDAIEHRRLSGPVRTYQPKYFILVNGKRKVVKRFQTAKPNGQPLDSQRFTHSVFSHGHTLPLA
jgi:hypothetical protein